MNNEPVEKEKDCLERELIIVNYHYISLYRYNRLCAIELEEFM